MDMRRVVLALLVLGICLGAAGPTCGLGTNKQDGNQEPEAGYLRCRQDQIELVPDFLDSYHDYINAYCDELDKARIPRECPRAKEESDRLSRAFAASYVSDLSERELTAYILQTQAALKYYPDNPEICSPEWVREHLGETS